MAVQLRRLLKGQHPKTRQQLWPPKAVLLDNSIGKLGSGSGPSDSHGERTEPNIARDGTEFTEAFARRGKRSIECIASTSAAERLRRRQATQVLNASGNKRQIEETLNDDELQDPDLVEFWAFAAEVNPIIAPSTDVETIDAQVQEAPKDD